MCGSVRCALVLCNGVILLVLKDPFVSTAHNRISSVCITSVSSWSDSEPCHFAMQLPLPPLVLPPPLLHPPPGLLLLPLLRCVQAPNGRDQSQHSLLPRR